MPKSSTLKSSVKRKQTVKKAKIAANNMSFIKKESSTDKMSVSNDLWRNITKTTKPRPQLIARPIKISTEEEAYIFIEIQQPSPLEFSVKRKRVAKKTKFVVDTLLSSKKKSVEYKTSQSNPFWPNITTTKSPKTQLRARPIEISTGKLQPSPLKSSVKAKQTTKKSTLAVDEMSSTKKESSNDKKSRSNPLGKIATNPVKSDYYLRPKNMQQMAWSKSFVDEKKISKNVTIAVKKVQSRKKVTAKVKKTPSKFPRKEVTKAEILNFIFRPEYIPKPTSSKSTVTKKKTTKKARLS